MSSDCSIRTVTIYKLYHNRHPSIY